MLDVLPFLTGLAAMTSAVLIITLTVLGEFSRLGLVVHIGWFLVAAYCQFLAPTVWASTLGLALQTVLAVYLVVRWRLA